MEKNKNLKEAGEKTAFVNSKAVQYTDERELMDLKDNPDVKSISTAAGKRIKEEVVEDYTKEETVAVGKAVAKSLLKVLRAQGNEVKDVKLTGVSAGKFNIHTTYGQDKGEDLFKFKLNLEDGSILLEDTFLCNFEITEGNQVFLPAPELESNLADILTKTPSDTIEEVADKVYFKPTVVASEAPNFLTIVVKYPEGEGYLSVGGQQTASGQEREQGAKKALEIAQKVAAQLQSKYNIEDIDVTDNQNGTVMIFAVSDDFVGMKQPSLDEKLGPKSKPETYIKDFEKSKAPQFKGKSKEKKRQMAIAAYMANKNEALDPVGKEDEDVNNDGKVNSTDKYLKHRRDTISKNMKEDLDIGHQDDEPGMLKADLYRAAKLATMLYKAVDKYDTGEEVDFPQWWQKKIIQSKEYLQGAYDYLDGIEGVQQVDLAEEKGTCCHKCGHVHVKGTAHPTPYITGENSCKYRK